MRRLPRAWLLNTVLLADVSAETVLIAGASRGLGFEPVLAPELMFGVLTVLRRYAAGVLPTAVASLLRTSPCTPHERFLRGCLRYRWRHSVSPILSAANAKNRAGKAHGGAWRRICTCAHSDCTICPANVPYTHTTSLLIFVCALHATPDRQEMPVGGVMARVCHGGHHNLS